MEISQPEQAFNQSSTTFTAMLCPPFKETREIHPLIANDRRDILLSLGFENLSGT
jgi:hypothetical protein